MINTLFQPEVYIQRRRKLAEKVKAGYIVLLGNEESSINFKDNWYQFRQDSTFLYYFGLSLPGLTGIIDLQTGESRLYGAEITIDDIIWTGPLPSLASLAERVGVDQVASPAALGSQLGSSVHYLPPYRPEHTLKLSQWLQQDPAKIEIGFSTSLVDAVIEQRSVKTPLEIAELHAAASLTAAMHLEVMQKARPGMKEHELVGIAQQVAWSHNVPFSFPPILTVNGQILHNHSYSNTLKEGQLVLFDGGVESAGGYAGDMTRTFPAGKQFTSQQADLYDIVYEALTAAASALRPGITYREIHFLACERIASGLEAIGLLKGDVSALVETGAHTLFFPHGLGHMLGLDVHDMENLGENRVGYGDELVRSTAFGFKSLRLGRTLKPGFALTVEPGIYLIPELIDKRRSEGAYQGIVDFEKLEAFKNAGGIRIENDYVITDVGAELLGEPLAESRAEVEAIRAKSS